MNECKNRSLLQRTLRNVGIILMLSVAFCVMSITSIYARDAEGKINSIADITESPISMMDGSIYADIAIQNGYFDENTQIMRFNTEMDCVQALRDGKVGGFVNSEINSLGYLKTYNELMIFPEPVGTIEYAFGFKKGSPLVEEFNKAMAECKSEGLEDELMKKWFDEYSEDTRSIEQDWVGEKGVLRYWVNVGSPPMAFIGEGGAIEGYTIDFIYNVAKRMGYNLEITECNFSGLIPALVSDSADIVGRTLTVTEERKESIDFSDTFFATDDIIMVRKADVSKELIPDGEEIVVEEKSFFESIADSFYNTFIKEDRWKLFAEGVGTTLLITIVSAICGSLLGLLLYVIYTYKIKWVNSILLTVNKWLAGVPVVVVLMVMYYIVFKKSFLQGIGVSIVTFTILFAIGVFGLIESGLNSLGKEQFESAVDLGFTKNQALFKVLLPQAIIQIMPLYRSKLVEHLKATAIVGYIAVQDLTKMGDLVRSATFEAFFPLIVTAIIYYLLGVIIDSILKHVEIKIKPGNHQSSLLKGVVLR